MGEGTCKVIVAPGEDQNREGEMSEGEEELRAEACEGTGYGEKGERSVNRNAGRENAFEKVDSGQWVTAAIIYAEA